MATVSFNQNLVIRNKQTAKKLQTELQNPAETFPSCRRSVEITEEERDTISKWFCNSKK